MLPSEVQPFLAGAYLIGLSKKDGGIRSIAIGDVYRRLTGKCLSSLILSAANSFFLLFNVYVLREEAKQLYTLGETSCMSYNKMQI